MGGHQCEARLPHGIALVGQKDGNAGDQQRLVQAFDDGV